MSDETAVIDETAENTEKGPRQRPQFTVDRDEAVFEALTEPRAREELAAQFGTKLNLIYLSLHRLREAGRVKKVRSGKSHLWARADYTAPVVEEVAA